MGTEVAAAARIVVKVGSSSLTTRAGGLDVSRLDALVEVLAQRRNAGIEVVLVSSGAVAAGLAPLALSKRPKDLATRQAAASVGQVKLAAAYTQAFGRADLTIGQVLLTVDDVTRRSNFANARRTLERLLALGVVPVINENDTVATHEVRLSDNDRLAALVAHLVHADALVLLSDVDALYDMPPDRPGARRIPVVEHPEALAEVQIGSVGAAQLGTGGMATKVDAASIAALAGIGTLVTSTQLAADALAGADVGTWFKVAGTRRSQRLLWLEHAAKPAGAITVDDGAVVAVTQRRMSLLPAGITAVTGDFSVGDVVDIVTATGAAIARGLTAYDSEELPAIIGKSTRTLAAELGPAYAREVMHRDAIAILKR